MKLVIQPLKVELEDGFKNDIFGRGSFGQSLCDLVINSSDPLVIAVDGAWGEGKTTFIKMWQGLLEDSKVPNIYIDAFANDYVNDPFVAVVSPIIDFSESHIDKKNDYKNLMKVVKKAGKVLFPIGLKAMAASTSGIVNITVDDLQQLKDGKKVLSDPFEKLLEERIGNYKEDAQIIESFRGLLSELPQKLKDNKDKPLVIIIDELDRCRPTFAVELLERIKHLFSVENIKFLLVINKTQLEISIKSIYGSKVDAYTYLQKFINVEADLPKNTEQDSNTPTNSTDISKYVEELFKLHELETVLGTEKQDFLDSVKLLANHFNLSLRQLEKVFTNVCIFYLSTSEDKNIYITSFVVLLTFIKVVEPELFDDILWQNISYDDVVDRLDLKNMDQDNEDDRFSKDRHWLMVIIKYGFSSEDEFNEFKKNEKVAKSFANLKKHLRYTVMLREEVFPFFARKLSTFNPTQ